MKHIVISDLHLGSKNCCSGALRRFLAAVDCQLILNGDVLDSLNLNKLKPSHWRILHRLHKLHHYEGIKFLVGNHDGRIAPEISTSPHLTFPRLIGCDSVDVEGSIYANNRWYGILHGDRFDPTLNWPIVTDAADFAYRTVQSISRPLSRRLKKWAKKYGKIADAVVHNAVGWAKEKGYGGMILGHTHFPEDCWIDGIHYLNPGCWTDHPQHYVEIDGGVARLVQWAG